MKNIMEKKKHEWKFIISIDSIEFSGLVRPVYEKFFLTKDPDLITFSPLFDEHVRVFDNYENAQEIAEYSMVAQINSKGNNGLHTYYFPRIEKILMPVLE